MPNPTVRLSKNRPIVIGNFGAVPYRHYDSWFRNRRHRRLSEAGDRGGAPRDRGPREADASSPVASGLVNDLDAVRGGFGPATEAVMTDKLRLGLNLGYWVTPGDASALVLAAERLGYESVWTAESWGSDALTPLAWYSARTNRIKLGTSVLQISARTPSRRPWPPRRLITYPEAAAARRRVSGPQVAEGQYGTPFAQPLARTREYVDLLRVMWRRQRPARSTGHYYPLPYRPDPVLGKPLMLNIPALRDDIPVYLGAQGPQNAALAAEIADGWLALFTDPQKIGQVYGGALAVAPPGLTLPPRSTSSSPTTCQPRCTPPSRCWGSALAAWARAPATSTSTRYCNGR